MSGENKNSMERLVDKNSEMFSNVVGENYPRKYKRKEAYIEAINKSKYIKRILQKKENRVEGVLHMCMHIQYTSIVRTEMEPGSLD